MDLFLLNYNEIGIKAQIHKMEMGGIHSYYLSVTGLGNKYWLQKAGNFKTIRGAKTTFAKRFVPNGKKAKWGKEELLKEKQ
jgi:hypothetical protein